MRADGLGILLTTHDLLQATTLADRVGRRRAYLLGIAVFVYGAAQFGWYISELNTVFLGLGLVAALIARMSPVATSRGIACRRSAS